MLPPALHKLLAHRQPEPEALSLATEERLEQLLQMLGRDANTCVAERRRLAPSPPACPR